MFCISINHKNTPADVREKFAFTTKGQRQFTERLKAEVGGCVVLSTCNRMEIYFTDKYEQVEKLLANDREVPVSLIRRYSMNYEGFQCVLHLCRVACGMDSMVLVQKAGEIIPEILSVVREKRPEGTVPFHMPDTCPECGAPVVRDPDGAALRCTGAECPAQRLRNIAHFASREAMDIDGLGISLCQSLIEAGLVHSPAELYALEPQSVAALDHMGKKSAENLMAAIEKSKDAGMARLLCAFGIRQVGQKAARVLAMHFGTLDKLMAATEEELMAIPDVGPTTAAYLRAWFDNPQSQHQIRLLRDAGVSFDSREQVVDRRFAGKTFVLTGALEHFSRDEASAIIERFGGKTSSSVSKKTSYLLAGENTGSKYQKALTLGTPIITEAEFLDMIQE